MVLTVIIKVLITLTVLAAGLFILFVMYSEAITFLRSVGVIKPKQIKNGVTKWDAGIDLSYKEQKQLESFMSNFDGSVEAKLDNTQKFKSSKQYAEMKAVSEMFSKAKNKRLPRRVTARHSGSCSVSVSTNNKLTMNNATIETNNSKIVGNNNKIIGDGNDVVGNNNKVIGNNNVVTGNNSKVNGDNNKGSGNNIKAKGLNNTFIGNNIKMS